MPLDPQVKAILEEDAEIGLPPYNELEPAAARKQMLDLTPPVDPELMAERVVDENISGPGGEIPIRLYYPKGDPPYPVVVYFHGGGWVVGNLDTHHALCHALSTSSGCLVAAVDYRLAPEHRYPAAIEDAYAATCWVVENAEAIQADSGRIAVIGDSAGGTLAAVVSMMARDKGGPEISLQVLIYTITRLYAQPRADGVVLEPLPGGYRHGRSSLCVAAAGPKSRRPAPGHGPDGRIRSVV